MDGDARPPAARPPATTFRRLLTLAIVTPLCFFLLLTCGASALWVFAPELAVRLLAEPEPRPRRFHGQAWQFPGSNAADPFQRGERWNRPPRMRHRPDSLTTETERQRAEWQQQTAEERQQNSKTKDQWADDIIKQLQAANP